MFLKFCKFQRKTPVLEYLFNKVATLLKRDSSAGFFSYEVCKIFKNTFFHRTPPVAASEFKPVLVIEQGFKYND